MGQDRRGIGERLILFHELADETVYRSFAGLEQTFDIPELQEISYRAFRNDCGDEHLTDTNLSLPLA